MLFFELKTINIVIAPRIKTQPISLNNDNCSLKIIIPKITLVTGSNILKIEAVVAPKYLTPCCRQIIPMIEVKIAIINEYP